MDLQEDDAVVKLTSSVRDKLKKRREALGSILSGIDPEVQSLLENNDSEKNISLSADVAFSDESARSGTPPAEKKSKLTPSDAKSHPRNRSNLVSGSSSNRDEDFLQSLLAAPSAKEKAGMQIRDEIMELLSKPTAKEKCLLEKFRSQTGTGVHQFCSFATKKECMQVNGTKTHCENLHFARIIQSHTDESLGDCSFLNTCFHMDTCKYIHYEVDADDIRRTKSSRDTFIGASSRNTYSNLALDEPKIKLVMPQWVQCDLRNLDLSVLGKFAVIMADPPWDIHMELPYGTMSDEEMRRLPIPSLQDEGLLFLWVTGRAMELGRECLKLWGYERVDEIIWVKTNQLQRIIRTGRTGHWLNHGKEHCLVGVKGQPKNLNRGLDCDVIVAEVRATSHKPDEIYGIIERLSPGTRKCELFGRPHNVQPNWVTLGNQLDGVVVHDDEMLERWNERYPEGYKMAEGLLLHARRQP